MFERFSAESQAVLELAAREARWLSSPEVEPEHLLTALLQKCADLATLLSNRLPEELLKGARSPAFHSSELTAPSPAARFSLASKSVLAYGAAEAESASICRYGYVEPKHILLGILMEGQSAAAKVLSGCGLDPVSLRGLLSNV